ncbi:hypothetical protein [Flexithrix dorotheae]|uniref:hypothetical protein n=1 Tax=Flexithrix dorotheae TaxID=70993 RepID=UPI000371754C|nr:hypothetical protein [Flexithrix dorotheae]
MKFPAFFVGRRKPVLLKLLLPHWNSNNISSVAGCLIFYFTIPLIICLSISTNLKAISALEYDIPYLHWFMNVLVFILDPLTLFTSNSLFLILTAIILTVADKEIKAKVVKITKYKSFLIIKIVQVFTLSIICAIGILGSWKLSQSGGYSYVRNNVDEKLKPQSLVEKKDKILNTFDQNIQDQQTYFKEEKESLKNQLDQTKKDYARKISGTSYDWKKANFRKERDTKITTLERSLEELRKEELATLSFLRNEKKEQLIASDMEHQEQKGQYESILSEAIQVVTHLVNYWTLGLILISIMINILQFDQYKAFAFKIVSNYILSSAECLLQVERACNETAAKQTEFLVDHELKLSAIEHQSSLSKLQLQTAYEADKVACALKSKIQELEMRRKELQYKVQLQELESELEEIEEEQTVQELLERVPEIKRAASYEFVGNGEVAEKSCKVCGKPLHNLTDKKEYCSSKCRQKAYKRRKKETLHV